MKAYFGGSGGGGAAGGTRAIVFSSEGQLGRMWEVWFLDNGFLYEATTYAELDAWLADILATWRFDASE